MSERAHIQPLWVKLHSLPLKLWSEMALTFFIGNRLGKMLGIDDKARALERTSMLCGNEFGGWLTRRNLRLAVGPIVRRFTM